MAIVAWLAEGVRRPDTLVPLVGCSEKTPVNFAPVPGNSKAVVRSGLLVVLVFAAFTVGAVACRAQTNSPSVSRTSLAEESLKSSLQSYLGQQWPDNQDTRYVAAFVDLNGDGSQEAIVYLIGRAWCGTGGCHMLVLAPEDSSYSVISRTPATFRPIRVLDRVSHGWRSIGVRVRGTMFTTGREPPYEMELPFDGETYPTSMARRLEGQVAGGIIISPSEEGTLLYP